MHEDDIASAFIGGVVKGQAEAIKLLIDTILVVEPMLLIQEAVLDSLIESFGVGVAKCIMSNTETSRGQET